MKEQNFNKLDKLSKTIIDNYQIRKGKKRKTAFISLLKENFPHLKIQSGGWAKNNNIIIGDLDKADTIITAHYDTCAVLPFPNLLIPNNLILTTILQFIFVGITYAIINFAEISVLRLFNIEVTSFINFILFEFTLILMLVLMYLGKANKHTMNDNTSGVITLLETMKLYSEENVCYVLFDNEEVGLLGSAYFAKTNKAILKNKLIINIDCVSDGDNIVIITAKKHEEKYRNKVLESFKSDEKNIIYSNNKKFFYPSDQINFKNYLVIAAFNKNKLFGYYVDKIHTRKDLVFDQNNIILIRDSLIKFVSSK